MRLIDGEWLLHVLEEEYRLATEHPDPDKSKDTITGMKLGLSHAMRTTLEMIGMKPGICKKCGLAGVHTINCPRCGGEIEDAHERRTKGD